MISRAVAISVSRGHRCACCCPKTPDVTEAAQSSRAAAQTVSLMFGEFMGYLILGAQRKLNSSITFVLQLRQERDVYRTPSHAMTSSVGATCFQTMISGDPTYISLLRKYLWLLRSLGNILFARGYKHFVPPGLRARGHVWRLLFKRAGDRLQFKRKPNRFFCRRLGPQCQATAKRVA